MPKRRDIVAIVLIALPWMLLISVWHQSNITSVLTAQKADTIGGRSDSRALKESSSLQSRDIVHVVRTEYIYSRPPPWSQSLPTLHIITPTYSRPVQKAELTRLANTLLHVSNLHWIVVEDSQRRTTLVSHFLQEKGLNYTHLNILTPMTYKSRGDGRNPRVPRGTLQRNLALRWLRETFPLNYSQPGVVYFADDDNTYSLQLFEEMRSTKKAYFKLRGVKGGYQESSLLRELVTLSELEPKASNCTKVLVWHTRTEKPVLVNEGKKGFTDSNVEI
ncbi:galactosylgalactosylxylosylprotein 3-beta-glucuronosyltransferase 1 isoform X2 [Xiphophorus hellerii]|uniref:galactosylgalactosylxylosylprotein 3-beta-glucuronosyltransferase 1 isoform X2 n=1 Tax=Xiphophorus hellerii TaxID=8084 RepID=UPI0013B40571|nr:galactosylgalactosylxylosylprotein 3-beta-glucuronosyltransferase 1-like isoform X2 [Xiphophorus hellerii]